MTLVVITIVVVCGAHVNRATQAPKCTHGGQRIVFKCQFSPYTLGSE